MKREPRKLAPDELQILQMLHQPPPPRTAFLQEYVKAVAADAVAQAATRAPMEALDHQTKYLMAVFCANEFIGRVLIALNLRTQEQQEGKQPDFLNWAKR